MKKSVLLAALMCVSGSALAVDAGLGISSRSDDSTIYIPINVSERFRIEPMLSYENHRQAYSYSLYSDTFEVTDEATVWTLGAGLFGIAQLGDSANVYYGGRIGYRSAKNDSNYVVSGVPQSGAPQEMSGYLVAPAIGIEYRFSKHFSIGGEAALTYLSWDGDRSNVLDEGADVEVLSTSTNIIFRYLF
jgi:hypothetical protein